MLRRLGQAHYRSESPSHSLISECSLPFTATPAPEERIEQNTTPVPPSKLPEERIVESPEIAILIANVAKRLNTIVTLTCDFTSDVVKMREEADELLDELRTRIRPFFISVDLEMRSAESLLRYNIDRANIAEHRIDWLLVYNKYMKEMRRILLQLAGPVCDDLEESLEIRRRGVIGRRPSPATVDNLAEMKAGMGRAITMLANQFTNQRNQA